MGTFNLFPLSTYDPIYHVINLVVDQISVFFLKGDGGEIGCIVDINYWFTDQANFTSVEMQVDGDDYTAEIPSTPTPGKLEYYIEAADIYGNENQADVYEVDVVKENASTQAKDGFIQGTDMASSIIITAIVLLIAVLFITFFYYSKEKKKE